MDLESFRGLMYRLNREQEDSFFKKVGEDARTFYSNELREVLSNFDFNADMVIEAIAIIALTPDTLLTFNNDTETEE